MTLIGQVEDAIQPRAVEGRASRNGSPGPGSHDLTLLLERWHGGDDEALMEFGPITPFPNGVAFIKGADPADWTVWSYGSSPLPHYQLGSAKFGPRGDLWVSTISEGVVRIPTGNPTGSPRESATRMGTADTAAEDVRQ
jgi:hypothetical protein